MGSVAVDKAVRSRNPVAVAWSRSSHSPTSLDSPYGDSGRVGVSSVTVSTSGVPYVAALEENTTLSTPTSCMALRTLSVPVTFCFRSAVTLAVEAFSVPASGVSAFR